MLDAGRAMVGSAATRKEGRVRRMTGVTRMQSITNTSNSQTLLIPCAVKVNLIGSERERKAG
jgi:hypothetical protein